jgi:hypothetical protein
MNTPKFVNAIINGLGWLVVIVIAAVAAAIPAHILIFLAGGIDLNNDAATLGLMLYTFWPITLLLLLGTSVADNISEKRRDWRWNQKPGKITTAFLVFLFLPIIFNGLSRYAAAVGWAEGAHFLFWCRWLSQPFLILAVIVLGALWIVGSILYEKSRKWFSSTKTLAV